jgi:hypothetical protein
MFEVFVNGYGISPIRLFETDDKDKASDCCEKINRELVVSGVPREVLVIHPQYQFYRNSEMKR